MNILAMVAERFNSFFVFTKSVTQTDSKFS